MPRKTYENGESVYVLPMDTQILVGASATQLPPRDFHFLLRPDEARDMATMILEALAELEGRYVLRHQPALCC